MLDRLIAAGQDATVLPMAPIAAQFAGDLGYRPETFLMAVAIGAGCDVLTPIGHQCNTLVMGPGGYRNGEHPRLGLPCPLESCHSSQRLGPPAGGKRIVSLKVRPARS